MFIKLILEHEKNLTHQTVIIKWLNSPRHGVTMSEVCVALANACYVPQLSPDVVLVRTWAYVQWLLALAIGVH